MKIILFGSSGLLGTSLKTRLSKLDFSLVTPNKSEINFETQEQIELYLRKEKPDVIINAAAFTDVNSAETDSRKANLINYHAVRNLSDYAKKNKKILAHFSTDFVFDGLKNSPYVETDKVNPQNKYGKTKLSGEEAIAQSGCKNVIFRTSWLYGHEKSNFVESILNKAQANDKIEVVTDKIGSPTYVEMLASASLACIIAYAKKSNEQQKKCMGIYHLACCGAASRYEFARALIQDAIKANLIGSEAASNLIGTKSSYLGSEVKRPDYSALDCEKIFRVFGIRVPHWRTQVAKFIEEKRKS